MNPSGTLEGFEGYSVKEETEARSLNSIERRAGSREQVNPSSKSCESVDNKERQRLSLTEATGNTEGRSSEPQKLRTSEAQSYSEPFADVGRF